MSLCALLGVAEAEEKRKKNASYGIRKTRAPQCVALLQWHGELIRVFANNKEAFVGARRVNCPLGGSVIARVAPASPDGAPFVLALSPLSLPPRRPAHQQTNTRPRGAKRPIIGGAGGAGGGRDRSSATVTLSRAATRKERW